MLNTLLRPAHLKEADLLVANARKLLHRRRDLLTAEQHASYAAQIDELETAARDGTGDQKSIEESMRKLDKRFGAIYPQDDAAGWRENCEVLLVAFVLAIAIRSYFLQPFKIPTGSMEPTLNGIVAHRTQPAKATPGIVRQAFDMLWYGRAYVDAVSQVDDDVVSVEPQKRYVFLDYSKIVCRSGRSYSVHASVDTLGRQVGSDGFGLVAGQGPYRGSTFKAGEPIVHGYVDTGDQVFVDKFTYNFRLPRRGDVFVFDTRNIPGTHRAEMDERIHSEYYIKRLAGTPNDTLRIDYPKLFINGTLAQQPGFVRVMSAQGGYRGYSNMRDPQFNYLRTPADTFTVPADGYFALGDNSFNSLDSRAWGKVPAENVVGRGLLVYWPFTRHWGLIH